MEECSAAGVVLVVLGEALVHVGACPDAVLMPFQGRKVDDVGEVRGEQLVTLRFEFGPLCREVSNLLVAVGHALVECRIHLLSEVPVGLVADRDPRGRACD